MKKILLAGAIAGFIVLNACNDNDDPVNPLVKTWRLDEISAIVQTPGFESNDFEGDASVNYTLELRGDLTFSRTYGEDPDQESENGNWEEDDIFIELDPEAGTPKRPNIFLFYDCEVVSVTDREMDIKFEETYNAFPDAKISEWFSDGTVNQDGQFTGTDSEIDSIFTNFLTEVTQEYNLNFDAVE